MMTVAQVSKRTSVSVRTLHHYDQIGLLKPTEVTDAGYRLYDDGALDKLYMILVYRELGLSLNEIGSILDAPDYDRNRVLEHQIKLMQERIEKLQNRISLAKGMLMLGVKYMDFEGFDPKKLDEYSQQAKVLYGKTDAYKEFEQKQKTHQGTGKGPGRTGDGAVCKAGQDASLRTGQQSSPKLGKGAAGVLYGAFLQLHAPDPQEFGRKLCWRWQYDGKHRQSRRRGHRRLCRAGH